MNFEDKKWLVPAVFLLTALFAFALYAGSIRNEFVWDDPRQLLQSFRSIRDAFFPPPHVPLFGGFYYRPVITLSYMLDQQLDAWIWKDSSLAFHLPTIVLHALNSGFVFLIGLKLFGSRNRGIAAAAAAGLLFATHPIHTESVCWMAGRSDSFSAFFLLPSLLCFLAWRRGLPRWIRLAAAAALFLLGLLAKESALGFLVVIVAADLLGISAEGRFKASTDAGDNSPGRSGGDRPTREETSVRHSRKSKAAFSAHQAEPTSTGARSFLPGWLAFAGATAVYFLMRFGGLTAARAGLSRKESDPVSSAEQLVQAIGFYISKVLFPHNLDAFIPKIPNPGISYAIGIATIATGGILAWVAWRRQERKALLLGIWYFACLAPSLATAFLSMSETPVAERYLYLPSAAFCLAMGYCLFLRLPDLLSESARRPAYWISGMLVLALTGAYSLGTVRRAQDWRSSIGFWKVAVARSPNEGLPHLQLGLAHANRGESAMAEQEYLKAIDPSVEYDAEGRSIALNNLGMIYLGHPDRAGEFFRRAIDMRPDYPTPYYGLGLTAFNRAQTLAQAGRGEEALDWYYRAESAFRRSLELNPQYVKAHNQLSRLLAKTGRPSEALQHIETVLNLAPRAAEREAALRLRSLLTSRNPASTSP